MKIIQKKILAVVLLVILLIFIYVFLGESTNKEPKDTNLNNNISKKIDYKDPILISSSNFLEYCSDYKGYGPYIVRSPITNSLLYGKEINTIVEIKKECDISEIDEFWVGFSSLSSIKTALTDKEVTKLKELGVTTVSYNPEVTEKSSTVQKQERENLLSDVSHDNPLIEFIEFTNSIGFKSSWAPLRDDVDQIKDEILVNAAEKGLNYIFLQEQRKIEGSCPDERIKEAKTTLDRYQKIFKNNLKVGLQLMSGKEHPETRCYVADVFAKNKCDFKGNGDFYACRYLTTELAKNKSTHFLSIWPIENEVEFIKSIRSN
jgi:hypothetical protein